MKNLIYIGRILFGIIFIVFGLNHFFNASMLAGYVPVPGGIFWVYLIGVALIAAGISLIMNKLVKISALLLAILLLIFVFSIHLPGMFNPDTSAQSMFSLLKDTGLAAAALFMSGYAAREEIK